ncbi:7179_t:CDS:10 [Funneliformis geosporum]|uniref:18606_t:CDS:1 n=1 Tax=Funneliformis geosporum TaxID=1117311 RepID=A0A9W4SMS1_9GLOM|nr:7179_t:CDS:10 [Funneliformis geosporum]CAI2174062.1 18606_t:CDS:10 [Funneliformis geosporum]
MLLAINYNYTVYLEVLVFEVLEGDASVGVGHFGVITCKTICVPIYNQKRFAHDLIIRKKTGKPIIKYGPGGRSSVSGHIATVFGCTGFLGRYVVSKLAKHGTQVVVPYRDEDSKRHLKVTGDLGQIVSTEFDLRNEQNIIEAVRHSDIVYNLIGRDYETKNFTFEKVHIEGAERIAKICKELGVSRLVHMSALNADVNSPSKFLQSKALGEIAVKKQFPDVTIVRPGYMYGSEDRFLNRLSVFSYELMVNHGETLFRPVNVLDVATALEIMLKDETTISSTYELCGTKAFSIEEIYDIIDDIMLRKRTRINVPKPIALAITKLLAYLPWPYLTPEDIERYCISDKSGKGIMGEIVKTFGDLGIQPLEFEDTAIHVVRRFRSNIYFNQPMDKNVGRVKKGVYYVEY